MRFNSNLTGKLLTLIAISCVTSFSNGQESENLVANGSFEEVSKKPKRLGKIEMATGWISPTGVRADLFTSGGAEEIDVPLNVFGKEEPKDGNRYAGIIVYNKLKSNERSYLEGKLEAPLKKGMTYCIKFYVSLAEASKYATNNIGIALTKRAFGTTEKVPIIEEPTLMHFENDLKPLAGRYNWTEICGVFEAKGGERWVSIGNFLSDDEIKRIKVKPDNSVKVSVIPQAYYYVDNISVQLLDTERGETCECATADVGESYSTTIYQKIFNVDEDMTPTEKIEAHQVFFAFGRDALTTEGEESLDFIAEQLKENPDLKIQIMGHCNAMEDSVGMENDYYAGMDSKRIAAVMKYLTEKGEIPSNRMISSTKGSSIMNEEIQETDDEDLRMAKNRRVTFKVR